MKLDSIKIISTFFCGAALRIAPLQLVSIIKSITARRVFEKFPKLKKEELWGGQFWSQGKYIGTVGETTSEKIIKKYIRNQSLDKKEAETQMKQLKLFDIK